MEQDLSTGTAAGTESHQLMNAFFHSWDSLRILASETLQELQVTPVLFSGINHIKQLRFIITCMIAVTKNCDFDA